MSLPNFLREQLYFIATEDIVSQTLENHRTDLKNLTDTVILLAAEVRRMGNQLAESSEQEE